MLKKAWKEHFMRETAHVSQKLPLVSQKSPPVSQKAPPVSQKSPQASQKPPRQSNGSNLSIEETIRQEEGMKLEQLGIKAGVAVDVRIEWPPGKGKKKWIPTTVRRVSKKKGYFQAELDADGEEGGSSMRFYVGEMGKVWRLSDAGGGAGAGAVRGSTGKQDASREVATAQSNAEAYVGARIEVLFDVDGQQDWYGGKILRKEKKASMWLVLFDDGDEDSIVYPDPKGEVRIVSSKKKRSAAKVINDDKDDKDDKEDKIEKTGKAARDPKMLRLRTGDLCRVLFEDDIKYLGVVTGKDPDNDETVIVFEDGEEHRVVLPDPDVYEATRDDALAEWEETNDESKNIPWWCAHLIVHPFEDGELDIDVPENWSRVLIRPPVKPKRSSNKSRQKARQAASIERVNAAKADVSGDHEMADAPSEMIEKKRSERSVKKPARMSEDVAVNEAGRDLAKSGDNRQKKVVSIEGDGKGQGQGQGQEQEQEQGQGQGQGQGQASQASKKKKEVPRESRKPRDRVKERENRKHNDIMTKAQSQYLSELEKLLLQDTPEDLEDDDLTDFVDAMSIFLPQTESLNSKDFCLVCGSSPNKEEVLYCRDCGDCFHTYCAIDTRARRIPKEKRHMWRCPACRICEVCNGEENWENMLCCDGCDRGFHTYCLKPAMKEIPNEGWKCNDCVHCVSCGAKHSGMRKDIWKKDCTLCITCFQLYEKKAYCPICKVVWRKEEKDEKAVCCDTCNKWVHPVCGGIDDNKYRAMQDEEEPGEWNCPKCTGDLEASDEEEIDKKYLLPSQTRIIEAHSQFEDFCHDRLKRLQRTCGAIEHVYQSHGELSNALAGAHMTVLAANITCAHVDTEDPLATKFEALKSFAIEHGHTHVMQDDGDLDEFVKQLRVDNKSGTLSEARLEFLQGLGFCYDVHRASHLRAHIEEERARVSAGDSSAIHASAHVHLISNDPQKAAALSSSDSVSNQSAAEAGQKESPVHADAMATCLEAGLQTGATEPPPKSDAMPSDASSAQDSINVQTQAGGALAPQFPGAAENLQQYASVESHCAISADSQSGANDDAAEVVSKESHEVNHEMSHEVNHEMPESSEGTNEKDIEPSHQNLTAEELSSSAVEPHAPSATDEVMTEASASEPPALFGGGGHSSEQLQESRADMPSEAAPQVAVGFAVEAKEAAAVKQAAEKVEDVVKSISEASTLDTIQVSEFEAASKKMSAEERAERLSGLLSLKKNLVKLEKVIDKHKFKDFVPFFDDVIQILNDPDMVSVIPKELQRVRAQALEDMPDAARRSLITGQRVREPQIVTSERHWSKPQLAATGSSSSFLQQMLPHVDQFNLEHDLHAHHQKTGRAAAPYKKKHMVPKNMASGARGGFSAGGVGGTAQGRVALHGSEVLSLMSQFYAKINPFVRQDPETHSRLCKHFFESDWRALTMEQLTHFVETTFRQTPFIVQCFYDVFRDYLESGDEEMVEETPPVAAKPAKPQQEHAAWFCGEVRRIYGVASPTYRGFIQTMNHYAHKDKDTRGTIRAIKSLFIDNPTLIVEFAHFVPETFKGFCTVDKPKTVVDSRPAGSGSLSHVLAASSSSSAFSPTSAAVQAPVWSSGGQQQAGRTVSGASPFNFDRLLLEQRLKKQQQQQQQQVYDNVMYIHNVYTDHT